jgi:hypothetical protein
MAKRTPVPNPFHVSPEVRKRRDSIALSKAVAELLQSGRSAVVTALDGKALANLGIRKVKPKPSPVAKAKPAPRKESLGEAIIKRHPSARRQSVAKAGRRAGRLDFKRANDARKER